MVIIVFITVRCCSVSSLSTMSVESPADDMSSPTSDTTTVTLQPQQQQQQQQLTGQLMGQPIYHGVGAGGLPHQQSNMAVPPHLLQQQQQHQAAMAQQMQMKRDYEQQQRLQRIHTLQTAQTRMATSMPSGGYPPALPNPPPFRSNHPSGGMYTNNDFALNRTSSLHRPTTSGFNRAHLMSSPAPSPTPSKKKSRMLSTTLGRFFKRNQPGAGAVGGVVSCSDGSRVNCYSPGSHLLNPASSAELSSPYSQTSSRPLGGVSHPVRPPLSQMQPAFRQQQQQLPPTTANYSLQQQQQLMQHQRFLQQQHHLQQLGQHQQQVQQLGSYIVGKDLRW